MNNNWTEFSGGDTLSKRKRPRVLLTRQKNFRFNRLALGLLGDPKAVRFLYDVGQSRIGIRQTDPDADHAFHLLKEERGEATVIRGATFCNHYGIRPEETVEFESIRVDDEGTLVLDLKSAKRLTAR